MRARAVPPTTPCCVSQTRDESEGRAAPYLPPASVSGITLAPDTGDGEALEIIVQRRRNKRAALKLLRKLLKTHGFAPRTLVTDKWRAYVAATGDLGLTAWRHQGP